MIICPADNTEHIDLESLLQHLKKIKIKQKDFFLKYYNKQDLLTGEYIEFKSPDQYLNTDFVTKTNLKKWIKLNPEKGKEWAINFLKKRKEEKQLVFAPTQVDLRSLNCPSIPFFQQNGGYKDICEQLGLSVRFGYNKIEGAEFSVSKSCQSVIIDTREQLPLKLATKIISKKLNVGDYGLDGDEDKGIYIERKNLNDFVGTLSEYSRFEKELERAKESNSYIIMLVESDINDALGFNFLPQMKWTKTNPSHIFKNLRDLNNKFNNFQTLFVAGRIEAAKAVIKLLSLGEVVKSHDLQYRLDMKEIKF